MKFVTVYQNVSYSESAGKMVSDIQEEIIRADDLVKIVKWHDDEQNKLAFVFYHTGKDGKKRLVKWLCEYNSVLDRETAFEQYQKVLNA